MLHTEFEELVGVGPLGGLFRSLPSNISFREAMDQVLTAAQMTPEVQTDILTQYADMAIKCAVENMSHSAAAGMTVDEVAAIKMYTMPAEPHTSSLYYLLNKALREQDRNKVKPFVKILWLLLHALKKIPPCADVVVYRGVKKDLSDQYRKGQRVTWQGFTSTSNCLDVLNHGIFLGTNGSRTLFNIILTSGRARMISALAMTGGEDEVLLPPNSRFEVEAILGPSTDGQLTVQLRELETIDPILHFDKPINVISNSLSDNGSSVGREEEEMISTGSPLFGLFKCLPSNISFLEAMDQVLTAAAAEQMIPGIEADVLRVSVEIAMDCANEDKLSHPAAAGMTVDEVAAIKMYTMSAEPHTSSLYYLLNKALREQDRNKVKPFVKILWLLLHALKKIPPCADVVVYRGVKKDLSDQYRKGQRVTWQGFTSTSNCLDVLNQDIFLGTNGSRTLFNIILTSGRARMISVLAMTGGENEVLLPPNSRFEIEAILGPSTDGQLTVQLREILPIDPILQF